MMTKLNGHVVAVHHVVTHHNYLRSCDHASMVRVWVGYDPPDIGNITSTALIMVSSDIM